VAYAQDKPAPNTNAIKSDIRQAVINKKANACPMTVRLAWHSSGTFNKSNGTGGSDGATMRFAPESTDPANAGLHIVSDLLKHVKAQNPDVSTADIWCQASAAAVEFSGGPKVHVGFGRSDDTDGARCPHNGLLPDASQGADHLREVFYRMGMNDQEIVALSGAHTMGRSHLSRSGFDGPWTSNPLKFDNEYFMNLLHKKWTLRQWSGNRQYEDESGELMMLPTDIALIEDPEFLKHVKRYSESEAVFFEEFSAAFSKLLALGTSTGNGQSGTDSSEYSQAGIANLVSRQQQQLKREHATKEFLEHSMHGSLEAVQRHSVLADVHARESSSGRTALHKAAFWGHDLVIELLVNECKLNVNDLDYNGDTALHDACRFGHEGVIQMLLDAGTDLAIRNALGQTPACVAKAYTQDAALAMLTKATKGSVRGGKSGSGKDGSEVDEAGESKHCRRLSRMVDNLLDQAEQRQDE
jgi:hypothetical protein